MKTVGIVACSNPQPEASRVQNEALAAFFENTGSRVLVSPWIYEGTGNLLCSGKQRADALMQLFQNPEVTDIFDISGGDLANEVLDYLDFSAIAESKALFWGYSDLTTVINAIYAKTGKSSVLYPVKNLVRGETAEQQRKWFREGEPLFSPRIRMLRGKEMEGVLVGGNLRCLLKLAGTPYFPDMAGKILLLEARSGRVPQMITYLSQLRSLGVFQRLSGILLGTFSQMEAEGCAPDMASLIRQFAGDSLPMGKTGEIGHGQDAKAAMIGKKIRISE